MTIVSEVGVYYYRLTLLYGCVMLASDVCLADCSFNSNPYSPKENTMRKLVASLVLGVLLAVPATVLAACADFITVGEGKDKQVCTLSASYTVNGVQFCEYSCNNISQ